VRRFLPRSAAAVEAGQAEVWQPHANVLAAVSAALARFAANVVNFVENSA
jgi:hypothetical protein